MNFKVYEVSDFTNEREFNLKDLGQRQTYVKITPPLKHFGSAPGAESKIMNQSTWGHLLILFFGQEKIWRIDRYFYQLMKELSAKKNMHVGSLKQLRSFW